MIRDSGIGKTGWDCPANRSTLATPLAFPSADGPGRPEDTAGRSEPGSASVAAQPWSLTPVLIAALCAVALFSIVLHDGLGLRTIAQAILVEQEERAERALQTIEVRLRLDADNTREVAALLARDPTFLDALHNTRTREAVLEQTLRQTAVDGVELVSDTGPVAHAADDHGAGPASPLPGGQGSIQRNQAGELIVRFVERVGSEPSGHLWLAVERRFSAQTIRDLSSGLGLEIQVVDADGVLFSTSDSTTGCFAPDRIAQWLARRPSPWFGRPDQGDAGCVAHTASIAGHRLVMLAQLPDEADQPVLVAARRQLGWIALLTLAVAALSGLVLARRLSGPIRALSARAEALAVRYTGHAVARGRNEMQALTTAFDAMTRALLSQFKRLEDLHLDEMQNSLELQRRYALMRLLRDLSTAAHECEDLEQIYERALDELGAYLDWPLGRVLFIDDAQQPGQSVQRSVWFAAQRERFAGFISATEALPPDGSAQGLIGRANTTGMAHWVTDLARLEAWRRRDLAVQGGLKSAFVIPIATSGPARAFIEFFSDHRVEASAEMIELIEAIHTELWQAGERRREGQRRGGAASAPRAVAARLDPIGATSR